MGSLLWDLWLRIVGFVFLAWVLRLEDLRLGTQAGDNWGKQAVRKAFREKPHGKPR